MRISTEDLPHHLSKGLGSLYVIHGEALLLAIEAADAIRTAAREAGYSERETLIAEQGFKWAELRNSAQSMSLFSSRKIIDLRIPSGKPGVEGAQALQEHCESLNADTLTLISLPRRAGAARHRHQCRRSFSCRAARLDCRAYETPGAVSRYGHAGISRAACPYR